jgi:hypothetical protein
LPRIVITHAVQDAERWLAGKAERAAASSPIAQQTIKGTAKARSHMSDCRIFPPYLVSNL